MYRTARTTPLSRRTLLDKAQRLGVSEAARQMGVSRQTVYRWRRRPDDLEDRPCRPHRSPRQTAAAREAQLLAARMEWRWGPDRIGPLCGISRRTAYRILRRFHAHRLRELFPRERPARGRFVVSAPGELVQVDIKSIGSLGRGGGKTLSRWATRSTVGWQHAHIAVDAASRKSYIELRPTLRREDCAAFITRAVDYFDAHGVTVGRVLTDNGVGYRRNSPFDLACRERGIRHTLTKPYHPWTNGRVERFIKTFQEECLYAGTHWTSDDERAYAIALWTTFYNSRRPHTALGGLAPDRWLRARGVTKV